MRIGGPAYTNTTTTLLHYYTTALHYTTLLHYYAQVKFFTEDRSSASEGPGAARMREAAAQG